MLRSGGGQHTVRAGAWSESEQVSSEVSGHYVHVHISIMEKCGTNHDTEDVTQEEVSLEPHVARRKRSLVSVIQRRLVRSLNEVEVCRYQDVEEERVDLNYSEKEMHHWDYLRSKNCEDRDQNSDRCKQKRRASFQFCSTKEIKNLYCHDNSPFQQYHPLFMSFADVHLIRQFSKTKYNTLV